MTTARLILAIISTSLEEVAIYVIWRFLLPDFNIYVPVSVLITVMVLWAGFAVTLFMITTRILKKQAIVGLPTMVGSRGLVASPLKPRGLVKIKDELWGATSADGDIEKGEEVIVVEQDGLNLTVRRADGTKVKPR